MMARPPPHAAAVASSPAEASMRRCRAQIRRFSDGRLLMVLAHCDGFIDVSDRAATRVLETTALRPAPSGDNEAWLREALEASERALRRDYDPTEGEVRSATVIAALVEDRAVTMAWAGDATGFLVRDGAICGATLPHTLARLLREKGEVLNSLHLERIVTHGLLGLDEAPLITPEVTTWQVEPGDRVLLAPSSVGRALREAPGRVRWGLPMHTVADLLAGLAGTPESDVAVVMVEISERT